MIPRAWRMAMLAASLAVVTPVFAQAATSRPQRQYFPPSDPVRDLAKALADAQKDGKRVLLDFGADWCIDCQILEPLFDEPSIAEFLKAHFRVVRVDMGLYFDSDKIKNAEFAAKYGVGTMDAGIPALVLLDLRGQIVSPSSEVKWFTARSFTAVDVLRYLKELAETQ